MSKQIDVTVPDSETLSSEKSKRFTVSFAIVFVNCVRFYHQVAFCYKFARAFFALFAVDYSQMKTNRYTWITPQYSVQSADKGYRLSARVV